MTFELERMGAEVVRQFLGYAGAACLSLVLVPQVVKTLRDRVDHASGGFLVLELLASSSFVAYGWLLPEGEGMPVVVSNASALLCTLVLVWAKFTFSDDRKDGALSDPNRMLTSSDNGNRNRINYATMDDERIGAA